MKPRYVVVQNLAKSLTKKSGKPKLAHLHESRRGPNTQWEDGAGFSLFYHKADNKNISKLNSGFHAEKAIWTLVLEEIFNRDLHKSFPIVDSQL